MGNINIVLHKVQNTKIERKKRQTLCVLRLIAKLLTVVLLRVITYCGDDMKAHVPFFDILDEVFRNTCK